MASSTSSSASSRSNAAAVWLSTTTSSKPRTKKRPGRCHGGVPAIDQLGGRKLCVLTRGEYPALRDELHRPCLDELTRLIAANGRTYRKDRKIAVILEPGALIAVRVLDGGWVNRQYVGQKRPLDSSGQSHIQPDKTIRVGEVVRKALIWAIVSLENSLATSTGSDHGAQLPGMSRVIRVRQRRWRRSRRILNNRNGNNPTSGARRPSDAASSRSRACTYFVASLSLGYVAGEHRPATHCRGGGGQRGAPSTADAAQPVSCGRTARAANTGAARGVPPARGDWRPALPPGPGQHLLLSGHGRELRNNESIPGILGREPR